MSVDTDRMILGNFAGKAFLTIWGFERHPFDMSNLVIGNSFVL